MKEYGLENCWIRSHINGEQIAYEVFTEVDGSRVTIVVIDERALHKVDDAHGVLLSSVSRVDPLTWSVQNTGDVATGEIYEKATIQFESAIYYPDEEDPEMASSYEITYKILSHEHPEPRGTIINK